MLKKVLACVLSAAMTLSAPIVSFGAETIEIECNLSQSDVNVGDTFYADFKITDNPTGYNNMQCYINFDSSKLQALTCEVEDIPDDLILYTDSKGINYSMFAYLNVNSRINFVPISGDDDYLGMADGKSTAGELGRLKFANILNMNIDGVPVNYTGTGTLIRMKFKAIAEGSSEISMTDVLGGYSDDKGNYTLSFNVNNDTVTIGNGGASEPDSETTTHESAEITTTSANNSNSSGGSGGSSGGAKTTATTEAATEAQTSSDTVIGGADTDTDINVISFTDVEEEFWGHDYIMDLAVKGVVNGYPDGSFMPDANIKRADFLIMLLRGLGIDTSVENTYENNFTDVGSGAYYAAACGIAKEMGIATGNPDGSFAPSSFITRQDMMILAKKALENKIGSEITGDTAVLDTFNDKSDISLYALESLAAMVNAGIVNGMGDGIAPKANTTRAQAAVIISKVMNNIK
ncbi:MAG: S-layer homology domain-containing protein [Clostridia bacterium]|nr:S-layer homology domain-containing protein [Clostridia bacterium]